MTRGGGRAEPLGGSWPRAAPGPILGRVSPPINLADPDFEPTDEQLIGLSKRAFAGVNDRHAAALAKMRAEIDATRGQVMKDLAARQAARTKAA